MPYPPSGSQAVFFLPLVCDGRHLLSTGPTKERQAGDVLAHDSPLDERGDAHRYELALEGWVTLEDGGVRNAATGKRMHQVRELKRIRLQDNDMGAVGQIAGAGFPGGMSDLSCLDARWKIGSGYNVVDQLTVKVERSS